MPYAKRAFLLSTPQPLHRQSEEMRNLTSLYSRCILSDYSYRYFYNDGFGKDYQILNLDNDTQAQHLEVYLTACLLAFFQQQKLFKNNEGAFRTFHIEKPLWIFVGSKVTATLATKDASDIVEISEIPGPLCCRSYRQYRPHYPGIKPRPGYCYWKKFICQPFCIPEYFRLTGQCSIR
jgi:hypothetical protein